MLGTADEVKTNTYAIISQWTPTKVLVDQLRFSIHQLWVDMCECVCVFVGLCIYIYIYMGGRWWYSCYLWGVLLLGFAQNKTSIPIRRRRHAWTLLEQGWTHKRRFSIDPFTWMCKFRTTSKNLSTTALYGQRMLIGRPAVSDGW